MSSGVAIAMMWISWSSPKFWKRNERIDMMNLAAAMPLLATSRRRMTRAPPHFFTHSSYLASAGVGAISLASLQWTAASTKE